MNDFLNPKNVFAVLGASQNPEKFGHKAYQKLKKSGYTVYGIHPKGGHIDGDQLYTDIEKLPQKPDVLNLVIRPEIGFPIIQKAFQMGIKKIWLQPGAESPEILDFCQKNNIECLHNQCVILQLQK